MRPCDACGGVHAHILLDGLEHQYLRTGTRHTWPYRLLECTSCGLGFIDPRPDEEIFQTFYAEDYPAYQGTPSSSYLTQLKFLLAKMRFAGMCAPGSQAAGGYTAQRLVARAAEGLSGKAIHFTMGIPLQLPPEAMIFEIGFGRGAWLYQMASLGYRNLYGYDLDANEASLGYLTAKGVHLSNGDFFRNQYPEGAFDLIRMEQVFEHLPDPLAMLARCRALLKPGGLLVMAFPCKDSLSRKVSTRHWSALHVPQHLFHHTRQSALAMLEKAGFFPLVVKPYANFENFVATIFNTLRPPQMERNKYKFFYKLFIVFSPLYSLLSNLLRQGDFLMVLAKPSNDYGLN